MKGPPNFTLNPFSYENHMQKVFNDPDGYGSVVKSAIYGCGFCRGNDAQFH